MNEKAAQKPSTLFGLTFNGIQLATDDMRLLNQDKEIGWVCATGAVPRNVPAGHCMKDLTYLAHPPNTLPYTLGSRLNDLCDLLPAALNHNEK
jgi:hypothetical protein